MTQTAKAIPTLVILMILQRLIIITNSRKLTEVHYINKNVNFLLIIKNKFKPKE